MAGSSPDQSRKPPTSRPAARCTLSALAVRPVAQVLEALRFATVYVESRVILSGLALRMCHCAACCWLAQANAMLEAPG